MDAVPNDGVGRDPKWLFGKSGRRGLVCLAGPVRLVGPMCRSGMLVVRGLGLLGLSLLGLRLLGLSLLGLSLLSGESQRRAKRQSGNNRLPHVYPPHYGGCLTARGVLPYNTRPSALLWRHHPLTRCHSATFYIIFTTA
jgi:hypothetical protein